VVSDCDVIIQTAVADRRKEEIKLFCNSSVVLVVSLLNTETFCIPYGGGKKVFESWMAVKVIGSFACFNYSQMEN